MEGLMRLLCRLDDIPDGGTRGFPPAPGGFTGLFAIRRGGDVLVYVNSCPHLGVSLDWAPDRFLSADGSRIVCATHGAEFAIGRWGLPARPVHGRPAGKRRR
jgi:nitrite reductase/ring-hydroxylating ferredoxin subunit